MIGTYGNGLHISNALTALYLATGQDTACGAENSIAHFDIEKDFKKDILCKRLNTIELR